MSLDPLWLFLSLIPGGIGFVLAVYGKKQGRMPHVLGGVAFMVYPYFATSVAMLTVVGVAIGAAVWYAIRAGW